jgi:GT2 family glycosyltransferase
VVRLTGVELLWPANPWTGQHVRAPLDEHAVAAIDQQLPGACLLVRRRALEAIGGWDERYWVWYEDVDLARRLLRLGHALYVPDAVFDHLGNASTSQWDRPERHRRLYHGTMRYGEAHLGRLQRTLLGLVVIAVTAPRVLALSRRRPEAARAYREILRGGVALVLGRAIGAPRALRRSACRR